MKRISRKVIILLGFCVLFILIVGGMLLYRAVDIGIHASIEHKSAKITTATVVDCSRSAHPLPSGTYASQMSYSICYKLDNLNQIEAEIREEYEAAEHHQDEISGPRCRICDTTEAARLKPGDKLRVKYLLANNHIIEIVALEAFGVELRGDDIRFARLERSTH
jgi:hypothetical protein